jgi:hypothetical protein
MSVASGRSLLRRCRLPACFWDSVQMIRGMSLDPVIVSQVVGSRVPT